MITSRAHFPSKTRYDFFTQQLVAAWSAQTRTQFNLNPTRNRTETLDCNWGNFGGSNLRVAFLAL